MSFEQMGKVKISNMPSEAIVDADLLPFIKEVDGKYINYKISYAELFANIATQSWVNSQGFVTGTPWTNAGYLTASVAASTYQLIGSYLTGITSGMVTSALGYTPYNSSNPANYITSAALTGLVPYTGANADLLMGATYRIGINSTNFGSGGHTFKLSVGGNILADRIYCGTFRDEASGNTWVALTGSSPNQTLTFGNAGISSIYMPFGSVGIGISSGVNARVHVQVASAITGTAFLVQNSTPSTLLQILNSGLVGIGVTPTATLHAKSLATTTKTMCIQAITLQTANLFESVDISGNATLSIDVYNRLRITAGNNNGKLVVAPSSFGLSVSNRDTILAGTGGSNVALSVYGGVSQLGNVMEVGDVVGSIKFAIQNDGKILMSSLPTSSAGLPSGCLWNDVGTIKIV